MSKYTTFMFEHRPIDDDHFQGWDDYGRIRFRVSSSLELLDRILRSRLWSQRHLGILQISCWKPKRFEGVQRFTFAPPVGPLVFRDEEQLEKFVVMLWGQARWRLLPEDPLLE